MDPCAGWKDRNQASEAMRQAEAGERRESDHLRPVSPAGRRLLLLVLVICLLGVLFAGTWISFNKPPEVDETWHLFIANIHPFSMLFEETRFDAHPPLSYILLRAASWIGPMVSSSRMLSLAFGMLSCFSIFFIARLLKADHLFPFLAAFLFALSPSVFKMSTVIRGYIISAFFLLGAFCLWLRICFSREKPGRRHFLLFLFLLQCAFWTEFVSAVLAVSITFTPIIFMDPQRRKELWPMILGEKAFLGLFFLGFAGLYLWVRSIHIGTWFYHVKFFYRSAGEGILDFAWRSLKSEFSFLSVLHTGNDIVFALEVFFLVVLCILAFMRETGMVKSLILAVFIAWFSLFCLGAMSLYPFGGFLRQQFPLVPFNQLLLAILISRIGMVFRGKYSRAVFFAAVVFLAALRFYGETIPNIDKEIKGTASFKETAVAMDYFIKDKDSVFMDDFGKFIMFNGFKDRKWFHEKEIPVKERLTVKYRVLCKNRALTVYNIPGKIHMSYPYGKTEMEAVKTILEKEKPGKLVVVSSDTDPAYFVDEKKKEEMVKYFKGYGLVATPLVPLPGGGIIVVRGI